MSPHFIVTILVLSVLTIVGAFFVGPFLVVGGLVTFSTIVTILVVSTLVAFCTIIYVIGSAASI